MSVNIREQGCPQDALAPIQESIDLYRKIDDPGGLAGALAQLGTTFYMLGDYGTAQEISDGSPLPT